MPTLEKYRAKILRFYRKHKRMPSYSELAELCGFKSKNAAHKLVDRLLALGAVAKDAGGRLIPQKLSGGR
jgi:DNA-binding IclR family transcriptional regulator